MVTITLQKIEYLRLKKRAEAFDKIVSEINPTFFFTPTERSRKKIVREFSETKLYNKEFLKSFSDSLKRSSLFTK